MEKINKCYGCHKEKNTHIVRHNNSSYKVCSDCEKGGVVIPCGNDCGMVFSFIFDKEIMNQTHTEDSDDKIFCCESCCVPCDECYHQLPLCDFENTEDNLDEEALCWDCASNKED